MLRLSRHLPLPQTGLLDWQLLRQVLPPHLSMSACPVQTARATLMQMPYHWKQLQTLLQRLVTPLAPPWMTQLRASQLKQAPGKGWQMLLRCARRLLHPPQLQAKSRNMSNQILPTKMCAVVGLCGRCSCRRGGRCL